MRTTDSNPHDIPSDEQRITLNGVTIITELRADGSVRVDVEHPEDTAQLIDVYVNGRLVAY